MAFSVVIDNSKWVHRQVQLVNVEAGHLLIYGTVDHSAVLIAAYAPGAWTTYRVAVSLDRSTPANEADRQTIFGDDVKS